MDKDIKITILDDNINDPSGEFHSLLGYDPDVYELLKLCERAIYKNRPHRKSEGYGQYLSAVRKFNKLKQKIMINAQQNVIFKSEIEKKFASIPKGAKISDAPVPMDFVPLSKSIKLLFSKLNKEKENNHE